MLRGQGGGKDEQTREQPNGGDGGVKHPHHAHAVSIQLADGLFLARWQGVDDAGHGAGGAAADLVGQRRRQLSGAHRARQLAAYRVLENHVAERYCNRVRQVAHEAERGDGRGLVLRARLALQRDQRGLVVGPDADAAYALVQDDLGPVGVRRVVDVQARAQSHQRHAAPDHGEELAGLLDVDARKGGADCDADDGGEAVHTGHQGGSTEHTLEIDRQEVRDGVGSKAMRKANGERQHGTSGCEEWQRDKGVTRHLCLNQQEQTNGDGAEYDETYDRGGSPGIILAAVLHTEKKHDRPASNGYTTEPVDGSKAF